MENGLDLPTLFTDGEQDLWPFCQDGLQRFDSLLDTEYAALVDRVEKEKNKFIELLAGYASQIGCSFTVTPPEYVNKVNGASNDIWGYAIESDFVQIPRFVLERRPKVKDTILFRKEVPAIFILVNMAHELSHLERQRTDSDTYHRLYKDKSPREERHKVNFTTEIREEEISTEVHAFKLLKKIGIPITPEIFVAQIPGNDRMPNYRQETIARLRKLRD